VSANEKLVFIIGPTAVGKTSLALSVAAKIGAEIVSADSMAVYRGMNIGVAKPDAQQQASVPHHLIDVVDIDQEFTVAGYRKLALEAVRQIRARGKLPLIVGGTGLYIKALSGGLFEGPAADWNLRKELQLTETSQPGSLHRQLEQIDPVSAEKLDPKDLRRIIRAIEVHKHTGRPISGQQTQWKKERPELLKLGLAMDRTLLYRRIEQRCDQMIEEGLIDETKELIKRGIERNRTAMQAIGYKEIIRWLNGEITREQALTDFKTASRRLAKRQLTWFRKDDKIIWNEMESYRPVDIVGKMLDRITTYLET
jgi:tRNA dimethylallyltransferase